jgi:hypothetical protein
MNGYTVCRVNAGTMGGALALACLVLIGVVGCEKQDDRAKLAGVRAAGETEQGAIAAAGPPTRSRSIDLRTNPHDVCSPTPSAVRAIEYDIPSEGLAAWYRRTFGGRATRINVICIDRDGKVVDRHFVQM